MSRGCSDTSYGRIDALGYVGGVRRLTVKIRGNLVIPDSQDVPNFFGGMGVYSV